MAGQAEDGHVIDKTTLWIVIISLGIGTYLVRYSFLGIVGGRSLPNWLLQHLKYVGVAVLPGLVAPLVVWPAATGGETDLPRLLAALTVVAVGMAFRTVLGAVFSGMAVLYLLQYLLT